MHRSEITIDLGALRRNTRRLREVLGKSELWAVVKADAYGHGAVDVAGAVLAEGARVLCVATTAEALELRREFPETRILVMGPTVGRELAIAREARLEVTAVDAEIPEGVPVHVKLDTGMGRWGLSELPELPVDVVGFDQPHVVVVTQGLHAQMGDPGEVTDRHVRRHQDVVL